MSIVRFIADLHIGHENMATHRGFKSAAEQDQHIIDSWNSVVLKRDTTYILGDLTMEKDTYSILDKLNGQKYVIGGNHDKIGHSKKLMNHVQGIAGISQYKGIFLTHCPIHPSELEYRVKYNIHGHIHEKRIVKTFSIFGVNLYKKIDPRYICVSCEHVDYKPKSLAELGIKR
jgi:calcineurin-like phosphoesterase family protein